MEPPLQKAPFKSHSVKRQSINFWKANREKDFNKDIDFEIDTLYEDKDILIINKPANLVVHPAPSVKEATLVDWF